MNKAIADTPTPAPGPDLKPHKPFNLEGTKVTPKPPLINTVPPPPPRDPWEQRFATLPYSDGRWRGERFIICTPPSRWTGALMREVAKRAGGFVSEGERAKLGALWADWQRLTALICEHNQDGALREHKRLRRAQEKAIGEGLAPTPLPAMESLWESYAYTRESIRENMRQVSAKTYDILRPACERLRDAARSLASEFDCEESVRASQFELRHEPSQIVKALVWFGLAGWSASLENYDPNRPNCSPNPSLWNLKQW